MHDKRNHLTALARSRATALGAMVLGLGLGLAALAPAAQAQGYPVTATQRATAQQVAARGVPLAELAPNAPDTYVVQRGDTLWAISGLYLKRPWRWPELWGMNLQAIANPHLIYPGQTLYLEKADGYARLSTSRGGGAGETVRVSPRTRYESLADAALPTVKMHLIEPFLVQPLVVDELALAQAPRIIATRDKRVIMANGDRAYVRGPQGNPLAMTPETPRQYLVFRNAVPLRDPETGLVLGYEAQYVGRAELARGESLEQTTKDGREAVTDIVPATVDLTGVKEEVRIGDRLLPAPQRSLVNYAPHAPQGPVQASVMSIYGSGASASAGQNQVITINRGSADGMDAGMVLQLRTGGERIRDKTDEERAMVRLPSEPNGLAMVFLTFERVSYALILQAERDVVVGDRLVNPE